VKPASRTMTAGDTLRLSAEALDAQGRVIPGVTFRYRLGPAARFEGRVDSLGLVTSGSTATLPITVTATLASARPKFETIEIKAMPGAAVRVDVAPPNSSSVSASASAAAPTRPATTCAPTGCRGAVRIRKLRR
jgi:hypothetical protein